MGGNYEKFIFRYIVPRHRQYGSACQGYGQCDAPCLGFIYMKRQTY